MVENLDNHPLSSIPEARAFLENVELVSFLTERNINFNNHSECFAIGKLIAFLTIDCKLTNPNKIRTLNRSENPEIFEEMAQLLINN